VPRKLATPPRCAPRSLSGCGSPRRIVPCAFALLAFGQQICALLFGHGNTDAAMVRNTGFLLMALAVA